MPLEDQELIPKYLNNNLINKYYTELLEDLKLTDLNLHDKSLRYSGVRAKWLMYLSKEKENLKLIQKSKEELKNSILNKKETLENKSILKQKNESLLLVDNEQYIKLNSVIDMLKETIEFLTFSGEILKDFGYNIKNTIELIKLEQV